MPPIRVLAASLVVLSVTSSAGAATVVAPEGGTYDQYSLTSDCAARGAAVASWTLQGGTGRVQVATRRPGAARFGAPVSLGPGRTARVALPRAGGPATAAFISGGRLRVAAQDRSGRWREQRLPAGLPTGDSLHVSGLMVRADGTAILALEARGTGSWGVHVLRRARVGGWTRPRALSVRQSTAGRSVVDTTGAVTAVWRVEDGGRDALRSGRIGRGEDDWGAVQTVLRAAEGTNLAEPTLAAGTRGDVAVLAGVQTRTGGDAGGRVLWRSATGPWRSSQPTSATTLAVGGAGQVWVGGLTGNAARRGVSLSRLSADGDWMAADTARLASSPPGPVIGGPGLGVLADGRPVAWWVADGGDRSANRWFAAVRHEGSWGAAQPIGVTDGAVEVCVGPAAAVAFAVQAGRVVVTDLRFR